RRHTRFSRDWSSDVCSSDLRETVAGDDFSVRCRPAKGGDLRPCVDAIDAGTRGAVPEVDVPIVGSTTGCEKIELPRAPSKRFNGGLVICLGPLWSFKSARIPNVDEVVISSRGELGAIGTPFEAADFRSVRGKLGDLMLGDANVMIENHTGTRAGRENAAV